ncbi:E3 ubiquitin-protein ligase RNF26 [Esox lucius]|nr:E3 ubiquitin-protein ligase RNF26 [Esox lucius]XP_019903620.2 E3 ubiquitin-protein ligase RNF26 [Esox lucius]
MDVVNIAFCAIGKCLETCSLFLDLVVWFVNWLCRLFSDMGSSLHDLPVVLSGFTLLEYWNCALFSFLTVTEVVTSTAHGAFNVLEGWLETLGGIFESFKMVGHLSTHVAWRTKELLHRGLLSGHTLLKQTCEGFSIAFSLVLYFVNTIINILLISTQNCFSAIVGAWEAVSGPLHKALELAVTLLTFLYSCLVGTSVLLWTPCQLALEFLGSLGHVFITVFMFNIYGLLVTVIVVSLTLLYLNPEMPQRVAQQGVQFVNAIPGMLTLQRTISRLYLVAMEQAQAFQDNAAGPQAMGQVAQARQSRRVTPQPPGEGVGRPVLDLRTPGSPTDHTGTLLPTEQPGRPLVELNSTLQHLNTRWDSIDLDPDHYHHPSTTAKTTVKQQPGGEQGTQATTADTGLLSLLKEHEERKKCVICQDRVKNVLLLPCRHLCLCRHCSAILLQQPSQQHSCPLCRQAITQTMDVFL